MEKKMTGIFDDISLEEAEALFDRGIDIVPDERAAERIKCRTMEKAGFHSKRTHTHRFSRAFVASAAAVLIVVAAFFSVGSDSALAAIQKLFHFIPGYGIMEDDGQGASDQILYMLDQPVSAENDTFSLSLQNAVASKNTITIMLQMTDKKAAAAFANGEINKQKIKEQMENGVFGMPPIQLQTPEGDIYDKPLGSSSSGSDGESWHTWYFDLSAKQIEPGAVYTLHYLNEGISVSFQLKDYESFATLEEIGATDVRNDISITATAKEEDGKLQVELYPINHQYDSADPESLYIYSFTKDAEYGYQGDDLHLQTNTGKKTYEPIGAHSGPNTKFAFLLDPADEELFLKIPFIMVQSREEQTVKLKVPKLGEKIELNQKVEFKGSNLLIKSIEREKWQESSEECLKLEYGYENDIPNKILADVRVIEVGALDRWIGGGGSWESDENGITARYWFMSEKPFGSTIKLKFQNPVYYLTDAYTLKLEQ